MPVADPVKMLEDHLRERNITPAEFARTIKTGHTMVGRILSRQRRPGVQIAARIEDAIGIPARAWGDWFDHVDRKLKKSA
jgi:antitoxin component HigA of HigAB toxin-antitoxin module